jgi:hypothetical protein
MEGTWTAYGIRIWVAGILSFIYLQIFIYLHEEKAQEQC